MNEVQQLLEKIITQRPAFSAIHGMYTALEQTLKIHESEMMPSEEVAKVAKITPWLGCKECVTLWPCPTVSAIKECLDRHVKD